MRLILILLFISIFHTCSYSQNFTEVKDSINTPSFLDREKWFQDSLGNLGYKESIVQELRNNINWSNYNKEQIIELLGKPDFITNEAEYTSYQYNWFTRGYFYNLVFRFYPNNSMVVRVIRGCG